MHLPQLIVDLAFLLLVSGALALVMRALNQPPILAYLLVGILMGPGFEYFPTVLDPEGIKAWGELGVIFLLFLLGLEFSFKKLFRVGKHTAIAATVQIVGMFFLGYLVAKIFGLSSNTGLFLGGIIAISSTTVIIKVFEELSIKTQYFAGSVFGILIIEDLFAVMILAFLATITGASVGSPGLWQQIGTLAVLLFVLVPFGLWAMPRLLRWVHAYLNDESRVILSVGLCLGVVILVTHLGFSSALGAFIMGAFMADTNEGERVEGFLKPVRDLFATVFFASVGLHFDPSSVVSSWPLILGLSSVVVVGKVATVYAGMRMAGQTNQHSMQTGLSMAQIGEFSFIIASLGMSLGVVGKEIYSVTVSTAILTTIISPYLTRLALRVPQNGGGRWKSARQRSPRLWDIHLVEFIIHPNFKEAGESLGKLRLREKFGVSLVVIHRGDHRIIPPTRLDCMMPYDRVEVFGSDADLLKFENYLQSSRIKSEDRDESALGLERIKLSEKSKLIGKTLLESRIRDKVGGLVLGIERKDKRIMNPDALFILEEGDIVWIFGNMSLMDSLRST